MDSPTLGEWSDQEFDVFEGDALVGHILRSHAASADRPWLWTISGKRGSGMTDRGYAESLDDAMAGLTSRWEGAGPAGR